MLLNLLKPSGRFVYHQARHQNVILSSSDVPRNFVRRGVQQIQLRTEDRENGDLGAVAP